MGIASSLTTATQARAILDDVTITLTVNHLVTGGTRRNRMIHDSKLILVQEGCAEPREPRNPQFNTARQWLIDRDYKLQDKHWLDGYPLTHRRCRYHYVPMKEAAT